MCKSVPHSEFSRIEEVNSFSLDFILNFDDEDESGKTLKVDIHYPTHIHETTSDIPMAPESGTVNADMLSLFLTSFYNNHGKSKANKITRN